MTDGLARLIAAPLLALVALCFLFPLVTVAYSGTPIATATGVQAVMGADLAANPAVKTSESTTLQGTAVLGLSGVGATLGPFAASTKANTIAISPQPLVVVGAFLVVIALVFCLLGGAAPVVAFCSFGAAAALAGAQFLARQNLNHDLAASGSAGLQSVITLDWGLTYWLAIGGLVVALVVGVSAASRETAGKPNTAYRSPFG